MKVVCNPSMQMEKFDKPVRSVNCYDNVKRRHAKRRKYAMRKINVSNGVFSRGVFFFFLFIYLFKISRQVYIHTYIKYTYIHNIYIHTHTCHRIGLSAGPIFALSLNGIGTVSVLVQKHVTYSIFKFTSIE